MRFNINIRILRVYWTLIISLISIVTAFCIYLYNPYDEKILLGVAGVIITFYFGISKAQIENDKFFKELFRDFNLRYSALNESLYEIVESNKTANELDFEEKDKILDYFNLCAEEYYWYKKNRINNKVWKSWENGIEYWFSKPIIEELWKIEMSNKNSKSSYYMNDNESFFEN